MVGRWSCGLVEVYLPSPRDPPSRSSSKLVQPDPPIWFIRAMIL